MAHAPGKLSLRPIADLLDEWLFVPSYQRGYRRTTKQVVALLDDLDAFVRSGPGREAYYCLQPVAIDEVEGVIDVVAARLGQRAN